MSENILREIAMGKPNVRQSKTVSISESEVMRSEKYIKDHPDLSRENLFLGWEENVGSKFKFTPENREYYWETRASLLSDDVESGRDTIFNNIRGKLDSFKSVEEKASYYQDNAYTWPRDVHLKLGDYYPKLLAQKQRKHLEDLRMNQILEAETIFGGYDWKDIDPEISEQVLVEEGIKAFNLGIADKIEVVNGRLGIPTGGGEMTHLYSLDDPELSAEQEWIARNDLYTVVKRNVAPMLERSREDSRRSEELVRRSLLGRLFEDRTLEEFTVPIIIDGAAYADDPAESAMNSIITLVRDKVARDEFSDMGEAMTYGFDLYNKIKENLNKRRNHG